MGLFRTDCPVSVKQRAMVAKALAPLPRTRVVTASAESADEVQLYWTATDMVGVAQQRVRVADLKTGSAVCPDPRPYRRERHDRRCANRRSRPIRPARDAGKIRVVREKRELARDGKALKHTLFNRMAEMLRSIVAQGSKALLLSAVALTAAVSTAAAEGLSWWCYGGSCCKMQGQAVTTPCNFGCSLWNGQQLAPSVLMGSSGYAQ